MRRMLAVILAMLSCAAMAGETAYAVRATALKDKPFADAATIATIEERGRVEVVARQAGWMQVKANDKTGWVKMLSLRFGDAKKQKKSGDSGLRSLFNLASRGNSGGTVTTGVRGLSEENLKNAQPDPQALETVQGYAADKTAAAEFAIAGSLHAQSMGYVAEPEKGSDE